MAHKNKIRTLLGNNIFKNFLAIIVTAVVLLMLVMFALRVYTKHSDVVTVPELEGLQINEAHTILKSKSLYVEIVDSVYKKGAVPGAILLQTPKPNNKVKEGRSIYVVVYSSSPQQIAVPDLIDYSERQAIALLNSIGFTQLNIVTAPSKYAGLVLSVEHRGKKLLPEEKIPAGSPLTLVVGAGMGVDAASVGAGTASEDENSTNSDAPRTQQQPENIDESFF